MALLEVGDVGEMSFGSGDLATFFQPLGESNERSERERSERVSGVENELKLSDELKYHKYIVASLLASAKLVALLPR